MPIVYHYFCSVINFVILLLILSYCSYNFLHSVKLSMDVIFVQPGFEELLSSEELDIATKRKKRRNK